MRLYLVQHGEARPEAVDPQRHLTDQGVRDTEKVADFLRPLSLSVAEVWHSGKPRARQTAELLAAAFSAREGVIHREGLAPKDPAGPVREAVEQSARDLMIVGHLPFLGKLAASLVVGDEARDVLAFRYAGVVCLERDDGGRDWKVAWMIAPDLLGAAPS
jgi:phosphohistidine phosphatase